MADDYVPRPEWELYCKSVNGELVEIRRTLRDIIEKLDKKVSRGSALAITLLATATGSMFAVLVTYLLTRR
jgi:VIT1/CCC1 family predicted Fe2+/Mn2+ transporter